MIVLITKGTQGVCVEMVTNGDENIIYQFRVQDDGKPLSGDRSQQKLREVDIKLFF